MTYVALPRETRCTRACTMLGSMPERAAGWSVAASILLAGCERVPSINFLGAYFPSWMACILIGIALTLAARRAFAAGGVDSLIGPRALVYPALALAFTLGAWVAFFRG